MFLSPVAQQIQYITKRYVFYSSFVNLVLGIISNILIILVFTTLRTFRGNQCAFYLVVESVANIGLLISTLPFNIAGYILDQNFAQLSVIWCKIQLMCSYNFGLFTLFTIGFLAFDQYLSTNHRPYWRQISTLKLAHRLTYFNICFASLHNLLFFIFATIGTLGCTIYHPLVKFYLRFFYYPVLSAALPLIATITLSLLAYRNVRRLVRRQIALVRRRLDHQMTAIALTRVISLIILGLPFICTSLYELNLNNSEDNYMEVTIYNLLSYIAFSLLYANFAVSYITQSTIDIVNVSLFVVVQFLHIFDYLIAFSSSS